MNTLLNSHFFIPILIITLFIILIIFNVYYLKQRKLNNVSCNEKKLQNEKQLFDQIRLAQMGEMISMLAHQWRQPLSAISSISGLLQVKAELNTLENSLVKEKAVLISEYTQTLSSTIDDFRNFFKPDNEKFNTSYTEIVNSVISIIEVSLKKRNIKLIVDLNSDVKFDTFVNSLKQVLLNLLKNAEDILVEKNIENPTITISTYTKKNTNILEVIDNGGGIEKEILPKIFDPYFSTKTKKNGTGLGLYMCKTVIEEHCHGRLSASNSSSGAVFRVKLKNINYE